MSVLDVLGWPFMGCGLAFLVLGLRNGNVHDLTFRIHAPQVVANICWAVDAHIDGDWWIFALQSALAGWNAYLAWHNRPRKKRRASKVAARVRDLGHRLAVVPVPGGAR